MTHRGDNKLLESFGTFQKLSLTKLIDGILNTPQPNCFTIQEVWETGEVGNGTRIVMMTMIYHESS